MGLSTKKQDSKLNILFINYEYFITMIVNCILLVIFTKVLFAEFAVTKSNILIIAVLELLIYLYGVSFVFIRPYVKISNRLDLSLIDTDHFKSAFLKLFKFFIVIYLLIATVPHLFLIFLYISPDSGADPSNFFYYNEILIHLFSLIRNFLWIKIADSFLKSNFDLIKNRYKKLIYTPTLFIIMILFASCSISTTYFKSFNTIATDTYYNSISNTEESEASDDQEYVPVNSGLLKEDTTLIYSINEVYTVDTNLNRIICYENEDYKNAKIVFEFDDKDYIKFSDADLVYKQDDFLYFCYPSKNTKNFTKAGFYSINLETKEYKLLIDDILNYNFNGKKQSNTFDCIVNSYDTTYELLSYNYTNDHTKKVHSFLVDNLKQYSIKKSGNDFYIQLVDNESSKYYINGQNVFSLKQSFIDYNKWFTINNTLFILDNSMIYKIDSKNPFNIVSKETDINTDGYINRFFYDPSFTNLNPPIAERYNYIFTLNTETLTNELAQSIYSDSYQNLPFDGSEIELYTYDDSTILAYNQSNDLIAYIDNISFFIIDKDAISSPHFIEFDVEGNPYVIKYQSIQHFKYEPN